MPAEVPGDNQAARDGETLVAAEHIEARYGATVALTQVDLTVSAGEIVTLIGPNGAGKSTLVRIVIGLMKPSAGRVWRRPALRIGYLPQRVAIDPPLLAGSPDTDAAGEFIASLLRATLRETHCTTLISGLRVRGAPGLTRLGIEEQIADGIIDLRVEEDGGRRHRVLAVRKMHGTRTNLDDHLFAILAGRGIVVGEA